MREKEREDGEGEGGQRRTEKERKDGEGQGGQGRTGRVGKDKEGEEGQARRRKTGKERVVALPQESTSWALSSVPSLDSRWFCSSPPLLPSLKPVEIFSKRENRSYLFITAF